MAQPETNLPLTKTELIETRLDTAKIAGTQLSASAGGLTFQNVTEAMEFAKLMAISDIGVRKPLRNNPGACLRVVIQAVEWGMSPYAVANKVYLVNDELAFESQLVQAVILKRAPIKGLIAFRYEGEGEDRVCFASATTLEGDLVEYRSPKLSRISPKNSPLWKSDPDQQLSYYSGRAFCRRHFPDVLLGIYDREEIEGSAGLRDVTPKGSGLASRLEGANGGFDPKRIDQAIQGAREGEDAPQSDTDTQADHKGEPDSSPKPPANENSAQDLRKALDNGWLPDGCSLNDYGALVVPDDYLPTNSANLGSSILAEHFKEIVSVSGEVLKSVSPDKLDITDPDLIADAGKSCMAGDDREAPDGASPAQAKIWLDAYDNMQTDADAS